MITQELVKEWLEYRDGGLYWLKNRGRATVGKRFGADDRYRVGNFFGVRIKEHRLIWFYHNGYWPNMLDHKNRLKKVNEITNLRETTTFLNAQNVNSDKHTSNQTGVGYHKSSGKWRARSWIKDKRIEIGRFDTEDEAISAYITYNSYRL